MAGAAATLWELDGALVARVRVGTVRMVDVFWPVVAAAGVI